MRASERNIVAQRERDSARKAELCDFAKNLSRLVDRTFHGPSHAEILVYVPYQLSLDGKTVEIPLLAGNDDYVITIARNEKS